MGGCQTKVAVTEPCDILVDIAPAPASVNAILIREARATAQGIARNQARVELYGCEDPSQDKAGAPKL